ncbi:MAG TPA: MoaD/ThiS family protein [Anaerolineales bacterium]|nr:MoaD/ThiS family protein [Anaerolineales bacterium]
MHIHLRLAEPFWRAVGQRDMELELAENAQVGDLLALLLLRHPALAKELAESPPIIFAGEDEINAQAPLKDGMHLHLVWPVAGG